jgi:hypothetical protein
VDTFPFSYHKVGTKEPNNSFQLQFGNSYVFTATPDSPDQRVFTLNFTGMQYYVADDGSIDATTNANINNMAALYAFYKAHRLHATFIFPHYVFGNVNCKFSKPLEIPAGLPGGAGVLPDFQLEMTEQP